MRYCGRSVMSEIFRSLSISGLLSPYLKTINLQIRTQFKLFIMKIIIILFYCVIFAQFVQSDQKFIGIWFYVWRVHTHFPFSEYNHFFNRNFSGFSFVTTKNNICQSTSYIFNQSMFRKKLVATCLVTLVSKCLDYLISAYIYI